jgi:hypothetical protein
MNDFERRLTYLERLTKWLPSRFQGGGGAIPVPNLFILLGYNSLPGTAILGVQERTDAVLGSEMPAGVGGLPGDTVIVAANPSLSPGLPNGVGMAQRLTTAEYVWVINDINCPVSGDFGAGQKITTGGQTVTLDKVSGGVTYRYILQIPYFSA